MYGLEISAGRRVKKGARKSRITVAKKSGNVSFFPASLEDFAP